MAAPFWQGGYTYFPGDIVQPVTAPAPNVPTVSNGDFGAGATGWDFTGGAAYVTTGGYGGGGCVRLPGNVADGLALNESKLFVQAGGTLTATAMIQQGASVRGAASGWVEIQWFDGSDTLVDETRGSVIDDGSGGAWKQSVVSSTRPAAATYARAGIHLTSVADHNHPIWGDNLTVSGASAGLPEGLVYKAVQPESGSSAANEPAWPSILGQQVIDNDVIWEAVTTSRITWTASPRYVSGASEPEWPTDMGGMVRDGTINWKAVPRRIEDEKCPNTKVVAILASKVFAVDKDIVRFSATANPLDWSSAEDAGYLATGLQQANANDMAVLAPYRKNLTAMNASSFQNWQVDPDPASMAILDQMDGIGSIWPRAAVAVANDLIYLSQLGVRSIGIANAAENLAASDVGAPIDVLVQAAIVQAVQSGAKVIATYYPGAGQYWIAFGDLDGAGTSTVFVYTMRGTGKQGAWSRYLFPFAVDAFAQLGNDLFVRHGDEISRVSENAVGDDVGGSTIPFGGTVWWPWLDFGTPSVTKMMEGFDIVSIGTPSVSIGYDQRNLAAFTDPYTVDPDTLPGGVIPFPLSAPTFSLRVVFAPGQKWALTQVSLSFFDLGNGP